MSDFFPEPEFLTNIMLRGAIENDTVGPSLAKAGGKVRAWQIVDKSWKKSSIDAIDAIESKTSLILIQPKAKSRSHKIGN
jgi:hypothetical protein